MKPKKKWQPRKVFVRKPVEENTKDLTTAYRLVMGRSPNWNGFDKAEGLERIKEKMRKINNALCDLKNTVDVDLNWRDWYV